MRGLYAFQKPVPTIPGFEGSGSVIEAGSGTLPRFLRGRQVACATAAPNVSSGMWAEYAASPAQLCVPLRKGITLEQGSTIVVEGEKRGCIAAQERGCVRCFHEKPRKSARKRTISPAAAMAQPTGNAHDPTIGTVVAHMPRQQQALWPCLGPETRHHSRVAPNARVSGHDPEGFWASDAH